MTINETTPELLAKQNKAVLIAAAGCGKTHMISEAIKFCKGKQLILTHTHAGVKSILDKLKKQQTPAKTYRVDTLAGFALRISSSYPIICNHILFDADDQVIYDNLYDAATNVLNTTIGRKVIEVSYSGLFVDEYQDCTVDQHKMILKLCEIIPTRILGDPLQGIFDFAGELVNWERDILPDFTRLPDLNEPWRWKNTNSALGRWLSEVRLKSKMVIQLI